MSPAHLHQYVASVSPGQLSESLPSSQVNICTCLPIHQNATKNAINETQFNFNTHTKKQQTGKHTNTHTLTLQHNTTQHTKNKTHKQPPIVPNKILYAQFHNQIQTYSFLTMSLSIGFVSFCFFDVDLIYILCMPFFQDIFY